MERLRLDKLGKSFKGDTVLAGVDLTVSRGETVAVYGPSGGGKTVLLNLISGALAPDQGDILIDGASVAATPPEHRNVGMAFQNFALYPHMSAFDNIASPLRSRGGAAVKEKVDEIATLLKIDRFLSHLPSALSNGQKQRTSLARALVAAPAILLLDDPLRNVDAKLRYEMRLEMPELFRRFEAAVIYVTQDCREAMALADRIAILRDGSIAQIGQPEDVYANPDDAHIGQLLGEPTMNLLPCQARVVDGRVHVAPLAQEIDLGVVAGVADGRQCLAGVRPEDVRVQPGDAAGAPARIEAVTPTNLRSLLVLRAEAGVELVAACAESEADNYSSGQQVRVTFDPAKTQLFDGDGDGGRRLGAAR